MSGERLTLAQVRKELFYFAWLPANPTAGPVVTALRADAKWLIDHIDEVTSRIAALAHRVEMDGLTKLDKRMTERAKKARAKR